MQTNFEMVHLRKCPPQFQKLSGLLHVFKNKIGVNLPIQTCLVSARFTYVLNDWGTFGAWPSTSLNPNDAAIKFDNFLFGLAEDCISELHLYASWPSLSEDMVVDNDVHSDFDPLRALQWSIRLRYADDIHGFLTSYMAEFLKIQRCQKSVNELISVSENEEQQDMAQALERITNPKSISNNATKIATGLTRLVDAPRSSIRKRLRKSYVKSKGPLRQEILESIMDYLLPDKNDEINTSDREYQQIKSAPLCSLTYKLAVCMTVVNYCHGGVQGVAQLWHEFVQEMRYRLENSDLLPNVGVDYPDLRTCLLHQKLQMLNCCISHKVKRDTATNNTLPTEEPVNSQLNNIANLHQTESSASFLSTVSSLPECSKDNATSDDDDEEFYECENDDEKAESVNKSGGDNTTSNAHKSDNKENDEIDESTDIIPESLKEPEGRLRVFGNEKLLKLDEFIYIPITQQSAPLTEDALDEQTKIFSSLGDSPEGANLRMKMQSASLLSDMQAFKAANPGCILEDFVRWYSPRDFIEKANDNGNVKGDLSERMKIPGNVWLVMWNTSKPVPIRRQKRLFDDTKEGEKVMLFLSSLNPCELSKHLLPMTFHHALSIVRQKCLDNSLPGVSKICDQLLTQISKLFHHFPDINQNKLEDVIRQFQFIESLIERTRSLCHKFRDVSNCQSFVQSLLENPEVTLQDATNGEVGKIITKYFKEQQQKIRENLLTSSTEANADKTQFNSKEVPTLPHPCGKEFILRTQASRPSIQSRVLPHKMYVVLAHQEFRLAGAFSSDTVFF